MLKFYKVSENDILFETDCGWVDGYAFGDRLLDGVMFKITIQNGKLVAEVDKRAQYYFAQLNQDMWLKAAAEFAYQQDIFYTNSGDGDVILYDHSKPFSEQQASFSTEPTFS